MKLGKTCTILCLATCVFTGIAGASAVHVIFNGADPVDPNDGTYYIGPYYPGHASLTLNGLLTNAACISYNEEVYPGETWTAERDAVSTFSASDQVKLLEAEWLNLQFIQPTTEWVAIHQAIWDVFNPGLFVDSDTIGWLTRSKSNYSSVNPNSFSVLVPNDGSQSPFGYGTPQTFLVGYGVPEPATILCAGSGIFLCMFGAFMRRQPLACQAVYLQLWWPRPRGGVAKESGAERRTRSA